MQYAIPAFGLVALVLAAFLLISECRRMLVTSKGDLGVLRTMAASWVATLFASISFALLFKNPIFTIAAGALALLAFVAIPIVVVMSKKIRAQQPVKRKKRR